jgi:hypothetical protein
MLEGSGLDYDLVWWNHFPSSLEQPTPLSDQYVGPDRRGAFPLLLPDV